MEKLLVCPSAANVACACDGWVGRGPVLSMDSRSRSLGMCLTGGVSGYMALVVSNTDLASKSRQGAARTGSDNLHEGG